MTPISSGKGRANIKELTKLSGRSPKPSPALRKSGLGRGADKAPLTKSIKRTGKMFPGS